ncbi:hypothetical protein HK405_000041, partial [Cladochytrium tenue]
MTATATATAGRWRRAWRTVRRSARPASRPLVFSAGAVCGATAAVLLLLPAPREPRSWLRTAPSSNAFATPQQPAWGTAAAAAVAVQALTPGDRGMGRPTARAEGEDGEATEEVGPHEMRPREPPPTLSASSSNGGWLSWLWRTAAQEGEPEQPAAAIGRAATADGKNVDGNAVGAARSALPLVAMETTSPWTPSSSSSSSRIGPGKPASFIADAVEGVLDSVVNITCET